MGHAGRIVYKITECMFICHKTQSTDPILEKKRRWNDVTKFM